MRLRSTPLRLVLPPLLALGLAGPVAHAATGPAAPTFRSVVASHDAKLAPGFASRLRYALPDGTLRVMVLTAGRPASVRTLLPAAHWYRSIDGLLATVTPDQLAALLHTPQVRRVEADFPTTLLDAEGTADVHARALPAAASVPPDGTENGTVSRVTTTVDWHGDAAGNFVNIAETVLDLEGMRRPCVAPTCSSYRLHVTDAGLLTLHVASPTGAWIMLQLTAPDGAVSSHDTQDDAGTTFTVPGTPGTYVVDVWVNSGGPSAPFAGRATWSQPSLAATSTGLWSFDGKVLRSADPKLSVDAATGGGVTVADVDSGIDRTHPDFGGFSCTGTPYLPCQSRIKAAVVVNQLNSGLPEVGDDLPTTELASGHGTHTAGIIAGNGRMSRDTSSSGVMAGTGPQFGVAPQASLVSVKLGDGPSAGLGSQALDWVATNAQRLGIRVVNNSWGCTCAASPTIGALAKALYGNGVLVTFAAGNGPTVPDATGAGQDASGTNFNGDGQSPYAISVAAYSSADHTLTDFSSRGLGTEPLPDPATWTPESEPAAGYRRPDLAAPGLYVWSTRTLTGGEASLVPRGDTDDLAPGTGVGTGGYVQMSGTSMATPQVTGAAALLFSACPKATVLDVMRALMAGANRTRVLTTGGGRVGQPYEVGYGGLDVRGSLDWMRAKVPACV